jgi:hypothetical protein
MKKKNKINGPFVTDEKISDFKVEFQTTRLPKKKK